MTTCNKDHRHNGWTNYETWNVALHMDNDEGSYREARRVARGFVRTEDSADDARNAMAGWLKETHEEAMPELSGTYGDLLGAALGEVDWYEIACHYVDEFATDANEARP